MPTKDGFQGVSNCYVFKSRLQEYAQKVELSTPVYETIKEGPSHEPLFRSTVTVNGFRYDSLPGFFNRKAAEQSAAEVALKELAKSVNVDQRLSLPVHETGLCKNLLQEYAQKMNFAMPSYQYEKAETQGLIPHFSCTAEIGGIRYIGAAARTKKEAQLSAARTALLAIQLSTSRPLEKPIDNIQLTVIPCKKQETDTNISEDTTNMPNVKKAQFKKKNLKRKPSSGNAFQSQVGHVGRPQSNRNVRKKPDVFTNATELGRIEVAAELTLKDEKHQSEQENSAAKVFHVDGNFEDGQSTFSNTNRSDKGSLNIGTSCVSSKKTTPLLIEMDTVSGVGEVVSLLKNCEAEASEVGCTQLADLVPEAIFQDVKHQQSEQQRSAAEYMEMGLHARGQDTDALETSCRQLAAAATSIFPDERHQRNLEKCGTEDALFPIMEVNRAPSTISYSNQSNDGTSNLRI